MTKLEKLEYELKQEKEQQAWRQETVKKLEDLFLGKYLIYGNSLLHVKALKYRDGFDYCDGTVEKIYIDCNKYHTGVMYANSDFEHYSLTKPMYEYQENIKGEVTKETFEHWKKVCRGVSKAIAKDMLNVDFDVEVTKQPIATSVVYDFPHVQLPLQLSYKLKSCPFLLQGDVLVVSNSCLDWLKTKREEESETWGRGSCYYSSKEVEWIRHKDLEWENLIKMVSEVLTKFS